MTSMVARLRAELAAVAQMDVAPGYTELGVDVRDLDALLNVVEGFAAAAPINYEVGQECVYCGAFDQVYAGVQHKDSCIWTFARRLCGMDGGV